jgi:hypothetical protein
LDCSRLVEYLGDIYMFNAAMAAGSNYELEKALRELGSSGSIPMTTGQLYIVVPTSFPGYTRFYNEYQTTYPDGSLRIQTTLPAAISACRAGRNDTIYVAPGFTLTVTSSNLNLNKAGITIIGLGNGLSRPTLTYSTAAATVTVSAANVAVRNFLHVANFLNVAAAYTIGAARDFRLEDSEFDDTSTILNFLSAVVTGATDNAADGLKVINCKYRGLATTENAFVSILGNLNRLELRENKVWKDATNDAGQFVTLSSKILLGTEISSNRLIIVGAAGATVGIFLTGSGTTSKGFVANNYVASLDTTTELIATAGTGLRFFENYYTGVADASGKLWPIVDVA